MWIKRYQVNERKEEPKPMTQEGGLRSWQGKEDTAIGTVPGWDVGRSVNLRWPGIEWPVSCCAPVGNGGLELWFAAWHRKKIWSTLHVCIWLHMCVSLCMCVIWANIHRRSLTTFQARAYPSLEPRSYIISIPVDKELSLCKFQSRRIFFKGEWRGEQRSEVSPLPFNQILS